MSSHKPSIPKGTRDFSPAEMVKRDYIFDTIRCVFQLYGFMPIETPAMENLTTLLGKYGEEGDKLLFRILDSGDYLKGAEKPLVELSKLLGADVYQLNVPDKLRNEFTSGICEKGLRYDLTVPFARYVVQNRNEITFPFKRYQIQPVWRADRPQKGRYREFFQCDVDVVGSNSLLNEVELLQIVDQVFKQLKIRTSIKLNNRKILYGIAEIIGEPEKVIDITIAMDKMDKIGLERVNEELLDRGISKESLRALQPVIALSGSNQEKLAALKNAFANSPTGLKGVEELEYIFDYLEDMPISSIIDLDLTLARGLNYYTGAIIEVKALDVEIGSIGGGGRYDNLTGIFGMPGVSGVGVSFGADRIYDVLEQLDLFPSGTASRTRLMFSNFGPEEERYSLKQLAAIRAAGINAEIYPESDKMKKQLNYANAKNIPFVVLAGESEVKQGLLTLKNMTTGEQRTITLEEVIREVKAEMA